MVREVFTYIVLTTTQAHLLVYLGPIAIECNNYFLVLFGRSHRFTRVYVT